jgi:DNA modification methylase
MGNQDILEDMRKTKNRVKYVNRIIHHDCLGLMGDLDDACIDLIYIDPPFGTGKQRRGEELPLGEGGRIRGEAGKTFHYEDAQTGYFDWLKPRLEEMARLLKPTGSMLVHLDWHASHYVKVMLDRILGADHFVNEIIWHYQSGGHARRRLARKFDSILWYAKGKEYTYNPEAASLPRNRCRLCGKEHARKNHMKRELDEEGRPVISIKSAGKVYRYLEDAPAPPCDVWLDIAHLHQRDPERTGYPTQKPLKLLERLVGLCSNPGDMVADFFAGTGTALIAAEKLGRNWLGCDASEEAVRVAKERMEANRP